MTSPRDPSLDLALAASRKASRRVLTRLRWAWIGVSLGPVAVVTLDALTQAVGLGWPARLLVIAVGLAAGAAIYVVGMRTPTGFLPEEDQGAFFVSVQLPAGASVNRTSEAAQRAIASRSSKGGSSPMNWARKIAGPRMPLGWLCMIQAPDPSVGGSDVHFCSLAWLAVTASMKAMPRSPEAMPGTPSTSPPSPRRIAAAKSR